MSGAAVGMSRWYTPSSATPSTSLTSARSVLPCDTTSTFCPRSSAGLSRSSHTRSTRRTVSARDSDLGTEIAASAYRSRYRSSSSMVRCRGSSSSSGGGGSSKRRRQDMTCSTPYRSASSALLLPVRKPECCSLRRGSFVKGTQHWSVVESSRHVVRTARRRHDVTAMSTPSPRLRSILPASRASVIPRSVRSTSTQPVNRLARFHSLCPWRTKIRFACSLQAM
mmetsp:Transcript_36204/g.62181  ORF Transcript_36204/g.62181 Transcript_36204/m.62181 type:complete len:224 (+) Transcript_36204:1729-2400(+)